MEWCFYETKDGTKPVGVQLGRLEGDDRDAAFAAINDVRESGLAAVSEQDPASGIYLAEAETSRTVIRLYFALAECDDPRCYRALQIVRVRLPSPIADFTEAGRRLKDWCSRH